MTSVEDLYVVKPVNQWAAPPPRFASHQAPGTMLPTDDPDAVFAAYKVVYLVPGAEYTWRNVFIRRPVIVYGNGATVKTSGTGPILKVVGIPSAATDSVLLQDITFVGEDSTPDRAAIMSAEQMNSSALWIMDQWRVTIRSCEFKNFYGAAVFFEQSVAVPGFTSGATSHQVTGCRFIGCRMGVAVGGKSEHSSISGCSFYDCQICLNVVGGNWVFVGNVMANCRCAYLHSTDLWYQSANPVVGSRNVFNSNIISNAAANGNLWPTKFNLPSRTIDLAAFYFEDVNADPPCYVGNVHTLADVNIANFKTDDIFCMTGCSFYGGANDVGALTTTTALKDKVYILGCQGRDVTMNNFDSNNVDPDFGTVKPPTPADTADTNGTASV